VLDRPYGRIVAVVRHDEGVTSAELTVVAALGASLLTGLASLGVVAFQERRRRKAADRDLAPLNAAWSEIWARGD
jgi:hypothetical protein